MSRLLAVLACCALFAAPSAFAPQIGDAAVTVQDRPLDRSVGPAPDPLPSSPHGLMAKTVAAFRAGRHPDARRARRSRRRPHQAAGRHRRQPRAAGDDDPARRDARPGARPLRRRRRFHRRRRRRGSRGPRPASAPRRRPPARPAHEPSHQPGRPRAAAQRPRHPRGDRLLGRPDPPLRRLGDEYVEDAAATFELPQLTAWQKRVLNTAVTLHRLPVRLGRHEREGRVAVRRQRAGRLRLLRLRLARLQAPGLPRRRGARLRRSRAARPTR